MPISELVIGAIVTLGGVTLGIIASILGYLFKKLWDLRKDVNEISQSYGGGEFDEGHLQETRRSFEGVHSRLDDLEDSLSYFQRQREAAHERLCGKIDSIISVLEEEGINGDLPEPADD